MAEVSITLERSDNIVEVALERETPVIQVEVVASGPAGRPGRDGADGYTPVKGVDYFDGEDGEEGPAGPGVPGGGSAGQVLVKHSGTDQDTEWKTLTAADVGAVAADQGAANAGKFLVVGNDGIVVPVTMSVWQGGNY